MQCTVSMHTGRNRTFLEHLDPRTKFFVVLLFASAILLSGNPATILIPAIIVAGGFAAHRIPLAYVVRRLRSVLWFALIITVVNMFTVSGDVLFELTDFFATRQGLYQGLLLSSRIVLLLLLSLLFVRSTPVAEMVDGIEAFLKPIRRKAGPIIATISITLNFVPMLIRTAQRIKTAQIARGAGHSNGFLSQLLFAFSATLPLFAAAIHSSEQLALAMEARGYSPSAERTYYSRLMMRPLDWLVISSSLGAAIVAGTVT